MTTPITPLQLCSAPIPDGLFARIYKAQHERLTGKPLTHEHRHFLAGLPVHCGDILELYHDGQWMQGRYEWTACLEEHPTLNTGERTFWLDSTKLLRWPEYNLSAA